MKVGDYVRDEDGDIFKIEKISYEDDEYICFHKDITYLEDKNKIKTSPNIIDLIEVGDYVNGYIIEGLIDNGPNGTVIKTSSKYLEKLFLYNKDIKSIVTKEQFEQMEYKVK